MKKAIVIGIGVAVVSAVTAIGVRTGLRMIAKAKATDEEN